MSQVYETRQILNNMINHHNVGVVILMTLTIVGNVTLKCIHLTLVLLTPYMVGFKQIQHHCVW